MTKSVSMRVHPWLIPVVVVVFTLLALPARAAEDTGPKYESETLSNGLKVIYAPMPTSPVTAVRVFYHVGSKDERPDRQGFAHMFEHMMFRGSEHVKPQEHMKLIGLVGGYSNAYTSFDETVYINTVPNNYTQMALWLEADRMSSFKVSPEIFHTERLVVAEEWRLKQNQPYGNMWENMFSTVFTKHSYRWTPIGNMDQLRAAATAELQAFFNQYYLPNNAVLVVAGNIDIPQTKKWVHQYYEWIPQGQPITRASPKEPEQTAPRRNVVNARVPLTRLVVGFPMPPMTSPDADVLEVAANILGQGQSSRLSRVLVTNDKPLCVGAQAFCYALEDGGVIDCYATLLNGKDPADVEKILREQMTALTTAPVTPEELEKAKQQARVALAKRWDTADKVAGELGSDMQYFGNLDRVKTEQQRLEAITAADIQRVAKKYFVPAKENVLIMQPGQPAPEAETTPSTAASQAATVAAEAPRKVSFPADYPTEPPMTGRLPAATFEKGTEKTINGVRVIVMEDHRIPVINWSFTMRQGGNAEPAGKEGLANLAAEMVRRGPKGKSFDQFNDDLESRGIELSVGDGGDITQLTGSALKEQFNYGLLTASRDILLAPAFETAEFAKLKDQSLSALRLSLSNPASVASRELTHALYGDSPLGRLRTPASLKSITLDDVKNYFSTIYNTEDAILMISGDISVADGQAAAEKFLAGLPAGSIAQVDYKFPAKPEKRRIILVDRPESKQSNIRMGIRAYDITSDDKFPGSLSGQMLSSGIDSRLGKYVRAEKGYVYGVAAFFAPGRQGGAFTGQTDTKCETTADTVEAMFKVFTDMKAAPVPAKELADAQFRVAGQLVMSMQTVEQQAGRRVDGILNGYPIDYYDKYAQRIGQVTVEQIQTVMNKYVQDDHMTIVVVGPAAQVKAQLEKLSEVQVIPMPATE